MVESVSHHSAHHDVHHGADAHHGAHAHYQLAPYFEQAVEYINSFAGLIVLGAAVLAGLNLTIVAMNALFGTKFPLINPFHVSGGHQLTPSVLGVRLMLGEQIALALGLLVASDLLDTVLKPAHSFELMDVTKMGIIAVLRTGLAYFLAKEIKELEEEHKAHEQHSHGHHDDHHHSSHAQLESLQHKSSSHDKLSKHASKNTLSLTSDEGSDDSHNFIEDSSVTKHHDVHPPTTGAVKRKGKNGDKVSSA